MDSLKIDTPGPAGDACGGEDLIAVETAREFLLARARLIADSEQVATSAALGRVLASPLRALVDVPGHDNSAMDGYAVHSADVDGDDLVRLRVTQRIPAGRCGEPLARGEAARIFTGAPLPAGADAVVMQEHCTASGAWVEVRGPVPAGAFVRRRGNDVRAGAQVLASGARLRPQELGLAASVGHGQLGVRRRPRVAIFSTGDELDEPGVPLAPGHIYNSNRYALHGLVAGCGCEVVDQGTVEDTLAATRAAIERAAEAADVVVTTGGVSVGEEDHVKTALAEVGSVDLWRVRVKPGKPLACGRVGDADFLGLPGNPVSTLVTFCLFVRPFLLRRLGVEQVMPLALPVRAGFAWPRAGSRREYLRARIEVDGTGMAEARLFERQGSDVMSSATWADGLVEIAENRVIAHGELVPYFAFAELLG